MHERGLVIGIVKRRRQQDHIEHAVGQLFPALLVELARGEAGPGALDERPRLVVADSARFARELSQAEEKAIVAPTIQKAEPAQSRQLHRLRLYHRPKTTPTNG